jgi:uncharacterized Tic20 family protein
MVAYLAVPFFSFLVPLTVYLYSRRRSPRVRAHARQALNVSITILMYDISAAIMAAMLALDAPLVAVTVAGPLIVALWLVSLIYLIRAASAAGRGVDYRLPHWLCAALVR